VVVTWVFSHHSVTSSSCGLKAAPSVLNNCRRLPTSRDEWVPVTMKLRVLRLRMEERPPIWRGSANILKKQTRTADKGWSFSWGGVGPGLILCYDLSNGKGTCDLVYGMFTGGGMRGMDWINLA
jgi:hypothetical protein